LLFSELFQFARLQLVQNVLRDYIGNEVSGHYRDRDGLQWGYNLPPSAYTHLRPCLDMRHKRHHFRNS